jgi:exopolysaccharide production protein ExoQ
MPSSLALLGCTLFVLFVIGLDIKRTQGVSHALWIPLIWFLILGTRPASFWFDIGAEGGADAYAEGSPFDRTLFTFLIVAGVAILAHRRVALASFISANRSLFLFYGFWLISILWSDFPLVTTKRLIKELGNVVMVLVVLTEGSAIAAVTSMLTRFSAVVVAFSVLLIKYYPSLGRSYNPWTYEPMLSGVTTHKNSLGSVALVSGLFLAWKLVLRTPVNQHVLGIKRDRPNFLVHAALLIAAVWLLVSSHSATSLVCFALGIGVMILLRSRFSSYLKSHLDVFLLMTPIVLFLIDYIFGIRGLFVASLGRDPTLTTRTDLWSIILAQQNQPLLGFGYNTFWLGDRLKQVWEHFEGIIHAHNGYLEIYLNGGFVGVAFLAIYLITTFRKVKTALAANVPTSDLTCAFVVAMLAHNLTEATLARHSEMWFCFLLLTMTAAAATRGLLSWQVVAPPQPASLEHPLSLNKS